DLLAWFRKNGVDPGNDPEVAAALERYDIEGDQLIIKRVEATRDYFRLMRGDFDGSPEAQAIRNKARIRFDIARTALDRFQATIIQTILPRLPEPAQDRLVRACFPEKQLAFFGSSTEPGKRPVVREVRRMKLTPAQTASVDALVATAERAVLDLARRCVLDNATYTLASEEFRQKQRTAPLNVFLQDLGIIEKKLDADVLALLTEQQRSEYDASPVIDPSETSRIKDEPQRP
ncbi:MAG: hypothetical protein K2X32_09550, partial [Phycisphaerales bacterium]|nr:hypothetical protein [Phycisphaerales bacterium]